MRILIYIVNFKKKYYNPHFRNNNISNKMHYIHNFLSINTHEFNCRFPNKNSINVNLFYQVIKNILKLQVEQP